jgi:hypothetical protein
MGIEPILRNLGYASSTPNLNYPIERFEKEKRDCTGKVLGRSGRLELVDAISQARGTMPHDQGLPQTGDSQEIAQDAGDCLAANRPRSWKLTQLDGDNDYGFDYQVQVVHPFRLQRKGTRSPKLSADGSHLSIELLASTLRYYDNTDEPVLLVSVTLA